MSRAERESFTEDNNQNAEFMSQVTEALTWHVSYGNFFFPCHVNFLGLNQIGAQTKAATTQVSTLWSIAQHLELLSNFLIKYPVSYCLSLSPECICVILWKVMEFFSS